MPPPPDTDEPPALKSGGTTAAQSSQATQALDDRTEPGDGSAQRRRRKRPQPPAMDVGRGRRLGIRRHRHGTRQIGLSAAAQAGRNHGDIPERHRWLDAQGDATATHDRTPQTTESIANTPILRKFHGDLRRGRHAALKRLICNGKSAQPTAIDGRAGACSRNCAR
jgi:hypothetical protein